MVENFIGYFICIFFGFCCGGFVAGSMAAGYYKKKFEDEMERQKELYRRL